MQRIQAHSLLKCRATQAWVLGCAMCFSIIEPILLNIVMPSVHSKIIFLFIFWNVENFIYIYPF